MSTIEDAMREDMLAPGDPSVVASHPAVEGLDEQVVLAQNAEQLWEDVEAALERIEGSNYGKCDLCGRKIPHERLDALPQSATCTECACAAEK